MFVSCTWFNVLSQLIVHLNYKNLAEHFPRCTAYNLLVQKAPRMQQETPSCSVLKIQKTLGDRGLAQDRTPLGTLQRSRPPSWWGRGLASWPSPKTSPRFQPFGSHIVALQALLNPLHDKILRMPLVGHVPTRLPATTFFSPRACTTDAVSLTIYPPGGVLSRFKHYKTLVTR